jgi:hypothetical protein
MLFKKDIGYIVIITGEYSRELKLNEGRYGLHILYGFDMKGDIQ